MHDGSREFRLISEDSSSESDLFKINFYLISIFMPIRSVPSFKGKKEDPNSIGVHWRKGGFLGISIFSDMHFVKLSFWLQFPFKNEYEVSLKSYI